MSEKKPVDKLDLIFLPLALKNWCFAALPLLVISAFVISKKEIGSEYLAYVSSFISFLAAAWAGAKAAASRGGGTLFTGAVCGLALTILLLSLGLVIDGENMSLSSIISVGSFSFSGSVFGSVILSSPLQRRQKRGKGSRKRKKQLG